MPVYKSIVAGAAKQFYDPGQSRDASGKWASTGAGGKETARRPIGKSVGEARRKAREIAGNMGLGYASPTNRMGRSNIAGAIRAARSGDHGRVMERLGFIAGLHGRTTGKGSVKRSRIIGDGLMGNKGKK